MFKVSDEKHMHQQTHAQGHSLWGQCEIAKEKQKKR